MRRRLDIGMSLIGRPSVLFLDEPTTGLDPRSRQAMWGLIEELVAEGTTTLLTTQYLDEADRLADEIVVIDHGTVIAARHVRRAQGAHRRRAGRRDGRSTRRSSTATLEVLHATRAAPSTVDQLARTVDGPGARARPGIVPQVVRELDAAGVPVDDVRCAGRRSTTCSSS